MKYTAAPVLVFNWEVEEHAAGLYADLFGKRMKVADVWREWDGYYRSSQFMPSQERRFRTMQSAMNATVKALNLKEASGE